MPHKRINFGTRISAAQQTTNHRGVATHTHTPLARLMLIEMHGLDCPFFSWNGIVIVFGLKWSVKRAGVCQKSLGINHILQFGKVHASAKRYLDTSIHRYNAKDKRVQRKCKYKCGGEAVDNPLLLRGTLSWLVKRPLDLCGCRNQIIILFLSYPVDDRTGGNIDNNLDMNW